MDTTDWYDINGKRILTIKNASSVNEKDHTFSYMVILNPWCTIPIPGKNTIINTNNVKQIINLDKREQYVINVLSSDDIFSQMIGLCSPDMRTYYTTDEEGIEDAGLDIFVCHGGASFIAFLWMGYKDITYESIQPYLNPNNHLSLAFENRPNILTEETIVIDQIKYLYGVYLIYLDHTVESHTFVAWFKENDITIYNSYGGHIGFYVTTFKRNEWLDMFINFFNNSFDNQRQIYHLLWGIKKSMVQGVFNGYPEDEGPTSFEKMVCYKIY